MGGSGDAILGWLIGGEIEALTWQTNLPIDGWKLVRGTGEGGGGRSALFAGASL